MLSPGQLSRAFARNAAYLSSVAADIDHVGSLHQPPASVNCLNWTAGHIVHYRNQILEALGAPAVGDAGELDRYMIESEPITADGPGVLDFTRLLSLLARSQDALEAALAATTEAVMQERQQIGDRETTRGSRVFFYYFHDTLHVGQADVLAQLARAGRDGR